MPLRLAPVCELYELRRRPASGEVVAYGEVVAFARATAGFANLRTGDKVAAEAATMPATGAEEIELGCSEAPSPP
jgi:hypothetical protein